MVLTLVSLINICSFFAEYGGVEALAGVVFAATK
jgi:hypothetical protein